MIVRVKSLQGDEYSVEVSNDQLVTGLKSAISNQPNGPPIHRQKLVFKGRTMQDDLPVSEYDLSDDCKVHMIIQKETVVSHSDLDSSDQVLNLATGSQSPASSTTMENVRPDSRLSLPDRLGPQTNRPSRCEEILRERLARHFTPEAVERIVAKLQHELDKTRATTDYTTSETSFSSCSSLDFQLERLTEQQLNINDES